MTRTITQFLFASLFFVLLSFAAAAQDVVSGNVSDSKTGAPLSGVTVTLKGTGTKAQTTGDGLFKINVPNPKMMIIINKQMTRTNISPYVSMN